MASPTSPLPNEAQFSSTESLPPTDAENDGQRPVLLREWTDPPVAPAVVVETTPDDARPVPRLSHFASYPVANLVRDFVRTGVNDFVRTVDQMMPPVSSASDPNLSIRSEPATYSTTRSSPNADSARDPYTVSARTINEMEDDGAEYILVDGDLIAVPASSVHHMDHLDDEDEPPLRKKACRKGRMQRGFRKVRKFFSRKKHPRRDDGMLYSFGTTSGNEEEEDDQQIQPYPQQQLQQQHSHEQQQDEDSILLQQQISPSTSPRSSFVGAATADTSLSNQLMNQDGVHPVAAAAAAKATSFRRQSSLGETSAPSQPTTTTSPNRREKRRNKVSWKKQPTTNRWGGSRKQNQMALSLSEEDDQKPRSRPSQNDGLQQPGNNFYPGHHDVLYQGPSIPATAAPSPYSLGTTSMAPYAAASTSTAPFAAGAAATPFAAAASPAPLMPAMSTIQEATAREQSVMASFVGTADEPSVLEAGMVLPAAEAFIEGYYSSEYDEKLKRDDAIPASLVPTDTDFKVDKEHAPDVEAMLRRAEQETYTDLDTSDAHSSDTSRRGRGKREGVTVPLSQAFPSDDLVINDNLKVILVGSAGVDKSSLSRAIRQSSKKPRPRKTLGVEVHTWTASDIRFHLWDVQGAAHPNNDVNGAYFGNSGTLADRANGSGGGDALSTPNFGAHPGTQSLFFSSQSLYLLVWDLACNNPHTHPVLDEDSDDDEDHGGNDWSREEANKQADRALQEDIENRVLSWVDRIARRGPRSAILPVGLIPDGMPRTEAQRRCDRLYELLEARMAWYENSDRAPNVVLDDSKNILCVNYSRGDGIEQLQETMIAIATDTSSSVFTHVGTPVPPGVVEVQDLLNRLKEDHKLIWIDHIIGELGSSVSVEDVINALHFLSSIGEILYFGTEDDDVLSQFVVLSRKWLVSAISCILRNDLKRELTETRRFMQMQCLYSEQEFTENDITRVLGGGAASNCPLLSGEDAKMLWQSMSFMREAADRYWQLNESSASAPTMFYFLERLLVSCGIFLPLGTSNYGLGAGLQQDEVYFVPSLLAQSDPGDVWTSKDIWSYRNSDSFLTTLCHSWLFRDGAPSDLFEHLTVALLKGTFGVVFVSIRFRIPV